MTTATKPNGQADEKITALYCRLSVDDDNKDEESNSITNQKQILQDFARKEGYTNTMFFVDDGVSGTTFQRPNFMRMERMAENGEIGTIIVKDLSRFGREQVEMGRLTQVVYPSLGIRFIAIQERVDTLTGDGVEMMPFHNIFNEWYAAQTSKKIRAVWQSKVDNGKRVSSSVPFGYMKDPNDKEKWLIDEPAAEVVRKIYALCLAGRGPAQIARQLEKEKILVPSAYYESVGRTHSRDVPSDYCKWDQKTVVHILENRQYTGCAVNFKTTTVSYKVHKTIYKPAEEHQVIPNMQEPIISEEQWLRVQELRRHRRRPTATDRTSLFSGLVYCPDCGAKLHFCAAKSLKRNQEFWRCSNYKSGRGECTIHFIRDVVLERIVLEAISGLAEFVKCHETVFLYMLAKKTNAMRQKEHKRLEQAVEQGTKRIAEIDYMMGSSKQPYWQDENGNYSAAVYGMEDYPLEKVEPVEGETDLDAIREKLATGKYVLGMADVDDNGNVEEDQIRYHAGDTITLVAPDGQKRQFEILTLVKENYSGLTTRKGEAFSFYTTADVFKEMASPECLMSYLFDVEDDREDDFATFIDDYTTSQEPLMNYESRQRYTNEFSSMTGLITLVGGVLTIVVGVIGILNFVNSILTGIVTRKRELAMMEAIGMTRRQLVQMLMLEGVCYAGFTILASLAAGCILSLTLVRALSEGLWFMDYHFVVWPMLPVFPMLLLLGVIVPYLAWLPQRKESVVSVISRET